METKFLLLTLLWTGMVLGQETQKISTPAGETQDIFVLKEPVKNPEVEQLRNEISQLTGKLTLLIEEKSKNDKEQYERNHKNFTTAVSVINEVNKTYDALFKDRETAQAYNILASINNSESKILGFSFSEEIIKILEKKVNETEDLKEKDKQNFKAGVSKLITGIADFVNPTSLIGSSIQFISGFVTSSKRNPIDMDFIKKFKDTTKVYQNYYATLESNNQLFNTELINLDSKYSGLKEDIDDFIRLNVTQNGIDINQQISFQVDNIFDYTQPKTPTFSYSNYNKKKEVKKVIQSLNDLKEIVSQLNNYYYDYRVIVNSHFDKNSQLLDIAKTLPKSQSTDITNLKNNLRKLKDGDTNTGQKGFSEKFQTNFKQISNYLEDIN